MNTKLQVIKKATNEIITTLATNAELQKLLMVDDYDINKTEFQPLPPKEMLIQKYICVTPQNEDGIKQLGRNTFLVVTINEMNFYNNTVMASIGINVVSNINTIMIDNYKDRTLEITDIIISLLDNLKLTSSVVLELEHVEKINYSAFYSGYILDFNITDQSSVNPLFSEEIWEDDKNLSEGMDEVRPVRKEF